MYPGYHRAALPVTALALAKAASQQVCRWPPPAGLLSCGVVVFGFAVIRLLCHLELAGREGQLNSAHAKGTCIYFNQVLLLFFLPNPLLRDMRSTDKQVTWLAQKMSCTSEAGKKSKPVAAL